MSTVVQLADYRARRQDRKQPEHTTYRVETRVVAMIFGTGPTAGGVA